MSRRRPSALALVVGTLVTLAAVGYPFAIYLGLTRWSARDVGLVLLVFLVPMLLLRLRRVDRRQLWRVLPAPAIAVALAGLTAALGDARFVLALPVLVSAVLLVGFGATLWSDQPMAERFARMKRGDELTPDEIRYCRTVTLVWCAFFAVNGVVAGALALFAPVAWWTLYAGLIAYVLIGALFTVEYLVRSYRFRHYGDGLHERLVARLFPPVSP